MDRLVKAGLLVTLLLGAVGCRPNKEALSAGSVGCPPAEIRISNNRLQPFVGETWTATCRGKVFYCTENISGNSKFQVSQVSCAPEVGASAAESGGATLDTQPTPVKAKTPPPTNVAGFDLGSTLEAAQEVCTGASHAWKELGADTFSCEAAPKDVGFPAKVVLHGAKGKLLALTLIHHPESGWVTTFARVKRTLEGKYGPPVEREGAVDEACASDARIGDCMERKDVQVRYEWRWGAGERIELTLGKPLKGEGSSAIRIRYTRPVQGGSPKGDSL